ncbi:glycosyltransferase [Paraburkholderia sp. CNPSo 3157]|uniref:Glycosyltransferase n=1 Tax=Paraburkholderia franconis TaxID=2654983 RepID=A0A7X1TJ32_9BURK|nr:glycosyltransferase family 25 protein [Paraburkholderia franconis]MPW20864.1 glycosyltransferase [Paraburkholderia franconis]
MFDVHVISLPRSGRRDSIGRVLSEKRVAFRFADAVDARIFTDADIAECYDDAAARQLYRRSMTAAEVACFLSHLSVWKEIASTGRGAVVLEDDAILEQGFFERVLHMSDERLASIADIVLLGRSKLPRTCAAAAYFHEPLKQSTLMDGLRVGAPFKQWTSGAVGYWISAQGARLAVENARGPIRALLDDWPWHIDNAGVRVAEVRPYVVWENFEVLPSSIEAERRALTKSRKAVHDAALWPLRIVRTIWRWGAVAMLRMATLIMKGDSRHERS